ncbi:MAG TPA: thioredoxin family protein [Fimbriimonadaceae bacterium]|nr:thioredoxin family protein [Fimbriimonadaceae bacterium]
MKLRSILVFAVAACAALSSASGLNWAQDFKSALKKAGAGHKVVMLDFTAVWCVNCHKLDRTTYVDPGVVALLKNVVPVHIDYDKEPKLAKQYKAQALPVIVFIDEHQHELGRISTYVDAKTFIAKATPILAKAKKR